MFDSHAHVAFERFDADREQVIERARAAGLQGWIEIGTNLEESKKALALAGKVEGVYATVGVHPSDIDTIEKKTWEEIEKLLDRPKVVAIGEVGLDFYRGGIAQEQVPALKQFIALAQERSLPIVFHVRNGQDIDAHEELLHLLEHYTDDERPTGVIHTYSGTTVQAQRYVDLGMHVSFSGVVTFKNAGELPEVAKIVPEDRILIETDCPFLAPHPYRGQRNEPAYVALVAEKLAEIRAVSVEEIKAQTLQNTKRLFGM